MLELTINPYTNYERTVEYYEGLVYYIVVTGDDAVTFTDLNDVINYSRKNDLEFQFESHILQSHWAVDSMTRNAVEVVIEEYVYYYE